MRRFDAAAAAGDAGATPEKLTPAAKAGANAADVCRAAPASAPPVRFSAGDADALPTPSPLRRDKSTGGPGGSCLLGEKLH